MDNNLMKLEKLIEKLDRIDGIEFPISDQELCERYENPVSYTHLRAHET